MTFVPVRISLQDLLGEEYVYAACHAAAALSGADPSALLEQARRVVDFFPVAFQERLREKLQQVGTQLIAPARDTAKGASTATFRTATVQAASPLAGLGYLRIGEDGKLYLLTKSEHYHAPLGHRFPGFELMEVARGLGVPNATHNNTRGHIARLLEEELVAAAAGLRLPEDAETLEYLRGVRDLQAMNCVLNLNTGSLAAEAALKMCLARFYLSQPGAEAPLYSGRKPVLLVMGTDEGEPQANYHGTTVLTQVMRGMWGDWARRLADDGLMTVYALRPNRPEEVEAAFERFEQPPYKIAGFFHEIVMMNYGARLLRKDYLQRAYALCAQHDVPTVVDEIQSGLWAPELFMFREYGLKPSAVVIGKGFPAGEYSASRIIFSAALDLMPQFGALVTNGQEELSSLAYLIAMRWAQVNQKVTTAIGDLYEERLSDLQASFSQFIVSVEGSRHLCGLAFSSPEMGKRFARRLVERGLDISMQTYKSECPPVALTKLPLIADEAVVEFVIEQMRQVLEEL